MREYRDIIFDLGNVLLKISYDKVFKYWSAKTGMKSEKLKKRYRFGKNYNQFEKGLISAEEYMNRALQQLKVKMSRKDFENGWNQCFIGIPDRIRSLTDKLAEDYRLSILTNTNSTHEKCWRDKFSPFLEGFEYIFCSHRIGSRKPEPAIYTHILDILRTEPGRILFLDDKKEHIKGAKKLGIKGFQVESPERLEEVLRNLKILK